MDQGHPSLLWTHCFAQLMYHTYQLSHSSSSSRRVLIMTLTILWTVASILEAMCLFHSPPKTRSPRPEQRVASTVPKARA